MENQTVNQEQVQAQQVDMNNLKSKRINRTLTIRADVFEHFKNSTSSRKVSKLVENYMIGYLNSKGANYELNKVD
jgi:hypothetical protein